MPLGRLSGLEIDKLLEELDSLHKKVAELTGILSNETSILDIVRDQLLELKRKYGDERRTAIEAVENEIVLEDLIEKKDYVITISNHGYIKRMPVDTYTAQKRGGKGISAMSTKEEDFVQNLFIANSHNYIMMFSNHGKVFVKKAYEIPEFSRAAKGTNLVNIIDLAPDETITAYIPLESINEKNIYLTMITKKGIIKRTSLELYRNIRKNGLIAINIDENDELLFVLKTKGESNLLIATHKGLAVYFDENDARPLGRSARGVRAINLSAGDYVVGAVAAEKDDARRVLTITENGLGKRTELSEYTVHNRGGKGMKCHNLNEKTGLLNGIALVDDENDVMLITNTGTIIRTHVSGISVIGRTASGVRVMRTGDDVSITSFTVVEKNDEEDTEGTENEADAEISEETPAVTEENPSEN
jgi:DNA gyrase subunit A